LGVVLLAIGAPVASAQAATGLEPGVHVDPGSPAAKEYALPLNQARQTGSSSSQPASEGSLFGAGIKPPGAGGGGHASSAGRTHTGSGGSHTAGTGATSEASANASSGAAGALSAAALRAARAQGPSGDGSLLALLGGGVAVLVLGGFGGTVLRHNRRPRPSP
jgi:hypothetical protein